MTADLGLIVLKAGHIFDRIVLGVSVFDALWKETRWKKQCFLIVQRRLAGDGVAWFRNEVSDDWSQG